MATSAEPPDGSAVCPPDLDLVCPRDPDLVCSLDLDSFGHRLPVEQVRLPPLLDPAEPPYGQGHCPGGNKEADDPVAHAVEVDRADRGQDPCGDTKLVGEDRDDLDAAD